MKIQAQLTVLMATSFAIAWAPLAQADKGPQNRHQTMAVSESQPEPDDGLFDWEPEWNPLRPEMPEDDQASCNRSCTNWCRTVGFDLGLCGFNVTPYEEAHYDCWCCDFGGDPADYGTYVPCFIKP